MLIKQILQESIKKLKIIKHAEEYVSNTFLVTKTQN